MSKKEKSLDLLLVAFDSQSLRGLERCQMQRQSCQVGNTASLLSVVFGGSSQHSHVAFVTSKNDTDCSRSIKADWKCFRLEPGKTDVQSFRLEISPIQLHYKVMKPARLLSHFFFFSLSFCSRGTKRVGKSNWGSEADSYSSSLYKPQEWFHIPMWFAKPDSSYQQSTSSMHKRKPLKMQQNKVTPCMTLCGLAPGRPI